MLRIGSSSDGGDLGEWKVALFLSGRFGSAGRCGRQASCVDVGCFEVNVGWSLVL